jgi:predicted ester cyclase
LSHGRFDRAAELYSPDFINHGSHRNVGLKEDQDAARAWKQAFPDLVITPEKVIAEGDLVTVYWVARGTNTGAGNGLPATGNSMEASGIMIWRIVGGRITDEWSAFDQLFNPSATWAYAEGGTVRSCPGRRTACRRRTRCAVRNCTSFGSRGAHRGTRRMSSLPAECRLQGRQDRRGFVRFAASSCRAVLAKAREEPRAPSRLPSRPPGQ